MGAQASSQLQQLEQTQQSQSPADQNSQQLAQLLQQSAQAQECGPACQKEKKSSELKTKYITAKQTLASAPTQLAVAEKAYLTYTKGATAYQAVVESQLESEASTKAGQLSTAFNIVVQDATSQQKTYETMYENYQSIYDLLNKYLSENSSLEKRLLSEKNDSITNDRKIYYESQQFQYLVGWYNFIGWCYFLLLVLTIILLFAKKNSYSFPVKIVIIVLFIIYPFVITSIISYIVKKIKGLYGMLPNNAYQDITEKDKRMEQDITPWNSGDLPWVHAGGTGHTGGWTGKYGEKMEIIRDVKKMLNMNGPIGLIGINTRGQTGYSKS
jgi:hypothetical protein